MADSHPPKPPPEISLPDSPAKPMWRQPWVLAVGAVAVLALIVGAINLEFLVVLAFLVPIVVAAVVIAHAGSRRLPRNKWLVFTACWLGTILLGGLLGGLFGVLLTFYDEMTSPSWLAGFMGYQGAFEFLAPRFALICVIPGLINGVVAMLRPLWMCTLACTRNTIAQTKWLVFMARRLRRRCVLESALWLILILLRVIPS